MSDASRPTLRIVRLLRLARIGLHLAQGLSTAAIILPWCTGVQRDRLIRSWSGKLVAILNVKIHARNNPTEEHAHGVVFAANHISWLDIWVVNSQHACRFIAKSEIRSWPIVGWLAVAAGTLFIQRERKRHTTELNREVSAALAAGDCVALFPEGTTSDGRQLKRFFGSLLQPAVDAGAPLIPAAIRYLRENDEIDPTPAFIDDMSMLESLRHVLRAREIRAEITFLPPIDTHGKTRRDVAHAAQQAIAATLNLPVHGRTPETAPDPQDA